MINPINPLSELIKEYFINLNIIYGYLFQMKIRLDGHKKNLQKVYEDNNYDFNLLCAGTAIPFSDLSEQLEGTGRQWYYSGVFSCEGKDYLEFAEYLTQRESALSIALGYEVLGRFLKNICSSVLTLNKELADPVKLTKFNEYMRKNNKSVDNYWCEYIEYSLRSKNYRDILKFIRSISPEYTKVEKDNNRNLNLADWVEITATVRHSFVHTSSIIKNESFETLTKKQKDLLFECYPGKKDNEGYKIKLNKNNTSKQFETLAEYGFLVYKCLSIELECEWDIWDIKKSQEVCE